jgi:hypothetical protein
MHAGSEEDDEPGLPMGGSDEDSEAEDVLDAVRRADDDRSDDDDLQAGLSFTSARAASKGRGKGKGDGAVSKSGAELRCAWAWVLSPLVLTRSRAV